MNERILMKIDMHATKNSIPEKDRIEVIQLLNLTLASAVDLYAQFKQAHWNVKGTQFFSLHTLFDDLAEQIEDQVDIVAERVTSLGGTALGTIQAATKNTQLREYPINIFEAKYHIEHLAHNVSILAEHARSNIKRSEKYNDYGTADLYIALTRMLDKILWFLEAHIQK